MDIKTYDTVPPQVEAVQVTGLNVVEIVAWINEHSQLKGIVGQPALQGRSAEYVDIQTAEGMQRAVLGDYVMHDGGGEFWPVARSVFERRYAEVVA